MTTIFSKNGFHITIERPTPSNFAGEVLRNGSAFATILNSTTDVYLTTDGDYTFTFSNESPTDPTWFIIKDYQTGTELDRFQFPLTSPLKLIAGIDGESNQNLSVIYPNRTFSITNTGNLLTWVCRTLPINCSGLESTINELPEPKSVGNLTDCSTEGYKGDITEPKSCNTTDGIFIFEIKEKTSGALIFSRIECCCPTVIPGGPPDFVCTCPDWGKATSYDQTLFSSSVRLRQWVLSNAGAIQDCKHIMAAKRIMGIEQPVYTDPPYNAPPGPPTPG